MSAMCKFGHTTEGRFGRIFKELPAFYMNPCIIQSLTAPDGPMDARNTKKKADIPVGFVILGQFIDHDITLDITSKLDRVNDPDATENFRTPALDLDCIYGIGPEASSYLYRDDVRLHTAKTSTAYSYADPDLKNHDLSRTSDERAIIGDFRNDENRIISQMQLAFIRFHNCVADYLQAKEQKKYEEKKCEGKAEELDFEHVREVVTWHYQWIVLHEFLPLFVGQDLVNDILCHGRKFYKPCHRPFIPIEFAAAAYRFGHSMIPLKLRVQKRGGKQDFFGSVLGMGFQALNTKKAIVDWDVLFGCGYKNYECADALDIQLASILLNLPFIHEGDANLASRNLLRGQSFLLPSGEEVAKVMEGCGIDTKYEQVTKFTAKVLKPFGWTSCTPLWFYVLAEAQVLNGGQRMGPVGGRIVAETIIGLLEKDDLSFLGTDRSWKPSLPSAKRCDFTICDLLNFCERKR